jgi:hypothetical protein
VQEEDDVLATLMKYEQGCATEPFNNLSDTAPLIFRIDLKAAMNVILPDLSESKFESPMRREIGALTKSGKTLR